MPTEHYTTEEKERGRRLKELREKKGYTQEELAEKIGKGRTTVIKYESGGGIRPEIAKQFADIFNVTTSYIQYGKEEPINVENGDYKNSYRTNEPFLRYSNGEDVSKTGKKDFEGKALNGNLSRGTPFYDFKASGGPAVMYNDIPEYTDQYISIPGLDDCEVSLPIWGDSMYPHYTAGDVVVCKRIYDKELIKYREAYLVVTMDYRMVKFIMPHDDSDKIILRSANPDYPDIPLKRDKILNLFLVKAKVQRKEI